MDMTTVVFDTPSNLCDILNVPCTASVIPPPCPADITADGTVNVLDLIDLLLAFGRAPTNLPYHRR